jgi:Putative beta-barrel porin-2, OmpL-like. bbp2
MLPSITESLRSSPRRLLSVAGDWIPTAVLAAAFAFVSTAASAQELLGAKSEPAAPAAPAPKKPEPFAFADFTWLTGNARTKDAPLDTKAFTGEFRVDTNYTFSFNHPQDDTISGSSEVFRSGEVQVTQLGIGGDFHYENVRGRLMTQFGLYSQTTPRNDASPARGQWNLDGAYRYISEAYGGYHWDTLHGINVDAGIFMSYIGLDSYYQFDNWSYQPSYVSSNTPWFFNGVRIQIFPSDKLKIEPWIINGWQSYGRFNNAPGLGGQILWRPNGNISILANNYWGKDALGNPGRKRVHTDDSIQVKYYDHADNVVSKAAFTFTFDAGCETGGGVVCSGGTDATPSQYFLGFMAYNRWWFAHDRYALTIGGGAINNPGRYLVLLPPINGATAASGTPYFTENPGDPYKAWDASLTADYMPSQFMTFRIEGNYRHANVPYFSGEGGVTPPGGNVAPLGSIVSDWAPDLRKEESRMTAAVLVKF